MNSPGRWRLVSALAALARGKIISYPTEAVWGLGCDPYNSAAVQRLLAIKRRPVGKGLILVAADVDQLGPLFSGLTAEQQRRLLETRDATDGRPTTWLIPSGGLVPWWITGDHDTVAIRISTHKTVAALCRAYGGPIVSTSANPAAHAPATSLLATRRYFGSDVSAYVAGETGTASAASRIRHLVTGEVLR